MLNLPRTGPASFRVPTTNNLDVTLFATPEVLIDQASIDEIVSFSRLQDTVESLNGTGFFGDVAAGIERVVLTPDFHRGAGIPVGTVFMANGFVVPKAVGNDIGCGMRLLSTDVGPDELARLDARFDARLRHIFFEGGRDVALSPLQREGVLGHGIQALLDGGRPESSTWAMLDRDNELSDLMRCHALGGFASDDVAMFADFIRGSASNPTDFTRDDQTGSVGGGNHFVEIQEVLKASDGGTAWRWGLTLGTVTIMAHSGSVGLGHQVGTRFMDLAREIHPGGRRPEHGFHVLPTDGSHGGQATAYLAGMRAAANFAFVNRLFLGLMVLRAMSETLGRRVEARLVHDAPHNLIWSEGQHRHLHRKGACPALGADDLDPEFPDGHPVIVPGSMGDSSWVLKGRGNQASFCSACHGAGRIAPRGAARKARPDEMSGIRVVGKIDPDGEMIRRRPDIAAEWRRSMLEEAPGAYKPVTPIIDAVAKAGIADPVAELRPILTVKG